MPDMDTVITNVISDIQGNAPTSGDSVITRTNHKRHQVKQAIGRKEADSTISAPTSAFVDMVVRTDGQNSTLTLEANKIYVTEMTLVKTITDVIIQVTNANGNIRAKVYSDNGNPNTLLGESGSTPATNGVMKIPVSATAGGKIWVGLETDSSTLVIRSILENGNSVAHTFGAGADPFGTPVQITNIPFVGVVTTENKVPRWYDANWS